VCCSLCALLLVYYVHFDAMWIYMGFDLSASDFLKSLEVSSLALVISAGTSILVGRCAATFPLTPNPAFNRQQVIALAMVTLGLLPLIT